MLKRLMATTAIVSIAAIPAFADNHSAEKAEMKDNRVFYERDIKNDGSLFISPSDKHLLASNLIGSYIYNGVNDDADNIGDVNDVVLTSDGEVAAVIAGIGGFLGIGEKDVAISIDKLSWKTGPDGERWLVGEMNREALEDAPEFDRDVVISRYEMGARTYGTQQAMMDEQSDNSNVDNTSTASVDKDEYKPITSETLSAEKLMGMNVFSNGGEEIGEVGDVIVGTGNQINAIIVDVGGFLGMGEKEVAVSLDNLMISRSDGMWDWTSIMTGLTAEELRNHDAYSEEEFADRGEKIVLVAPVPTSQ